MRNPPLPNAMHQWAMDPGMSSYIFLLCTSSSTTTLWRLSRERQVTSEMTS